MPLTGNEEKSSAELLQDDDPLSLVDTGEHNGDGAAAQGRTDFPHLAGEELLRGSGSGPENAERVKKKLRPTDVKQRRRKHCFDNVSGEV